MSAPYRIFPDQPLLFRLVNGALHSGVPGAWRLYRLLHMQLVGRAAPVEIMPGNALLLPMTWPGLVNGRGLEGYEPDAITAFSAAVAALGPGVTLIDCGADVGAVSRLVLARVTNVTKLIAFEPNPDSLSLLYDNLTGLSGIVVNVRGTAVSDVPGEAVLVIDPRQDHDHGAYLSREGGKGVKVVVETIDGLGLAPRPLALKIDVEGEELKVMEGARATLAQAPAFCVQLEAHPGVSRRTGVEPQACLALLAELGAQSFSAYCEQTRERLDDLSPDRPFFSQANPDHIYDVVAFKGQGVPASETVLH